MTTDQEVVKKVRLADLKQKRGTGKPKAKTSKGKEPISKEAVEKELFNAAERIIRSYTSGSAKIDDAAKRLYNLMSDTGKGVSIGQIYFNMVARAPMSNKERQAALKELTTGRDGVYNKWEHLGDGNAISAEEIERMQKLREKYEDELKKAKQEAHEKSTAENLRGKRGKGNVVQQIVTGTKEDQHTINRAKGRPGGR